MPNCILRWDNKLPVEMLTFFDVMHCDPILSCCHTAHLDLFQKRKKNSRTRREITRHLFESALSLQFNDVSRFNGWSFFLLLWYFSSRRDWTFTKTTLKRGITQRLHPVLVFKIIIDYQLTLLLIQLPFRFSAAEAGTVTSRTNSRPHWFQ